MSSILNSNLNALHEVRRIDVCVINRIQTILNSFEFTLSQYTSKMSNDSYIESIQRERVIRIEKLIA